MGKRYQIGSVSKVHGSWLGRWREGGERRVQKLGGVSRMTKSEAKEKLPEILRPINATMDVDRRIDAVNTTNGQHLGCTRIWKAASY